MQGRTILKTTIGAALALVVANHAEAQAMDETSQATLDTVMALSVPWVAGTWTPSKH